MVHSLILTIFLIFYVSFRQCLLAASIALSVHSNGYGKGSDVCVSRLLGCTVSAHLAFVWPHAATMRQNSRTRPGNNTYDLGAHSHVPSPRFSR